MCLNICSSVCETILEGLGGVPLLEKVCHFEVSKPTSFQVSSLDLDVSSATAPVPCLPTIYHAPHQNGHEL